MEAALFVVYLLLFLVVLNKIPFLKKSGIGTWPLMALFVIKIIAGCAYAKFYTLSRYYAGSDTWRFYRLSLGETNWLLRDPAAFIKDLFLYGYSKPGNLFSGANTYWNDLKSNIIVKMLAVMNVFTRNSYYTNIIIFNFLFLFGLVALFKLFHSLYPQKKWFIIGGIFLLPSTLFWCSGIHKDGLILSATGLIIYAINKGLKNRFTIKKTILIVLAFLLVFSLRNYIVFALVPALVCWALSKRYPSKTLLIFLGTYAIAIALFFCIPLILPTLNFPLYLAQKQHEFLQLEGESMVAFQPLQPTLKSFISFLPNAVDMAFFRPHLAEIKNLSYLPAALEVLVLILLVAISLIFLNKTQKIQPVIWFSIAFSITVMLLCGYTIPFTGAIVRYRSFALPLLITPLLCISNFQSIETKLWSVLSKLKR